MAHNLYSSHIYNCGSRTKPCEYCKKNIILRDFEYHIDVCCTEDYETCEGEKYINYQFNDASLLDLSKKNPFNSKVYNCKTDIKIIKEAENIEKSNESSINNEALLKIFNQLENDCNFEYNIIDENYSQSNVRDKESFKLKLQKTFDSKEEIGFEVRKKLTEVSINDLQDNEISDAMFYIILTLDSNLFQ